MNAKDKQTTVKKSFKQDRRKNEISRKVNILLRFERVYTLHTNTPICERKCTEKGQKTQAHIQTQKKSFLHPLIVLV